MDLVSGAMAAVAGGTGGLAIVGGMLSFKLMSDWKRRKGSLLLARPYDRQNLVVFQRLSGDRVVGYSSNLSDIINPVGGDVCGV